MMSLSSSSSSSMYDAPRSESMMQSARDPATSWNAPSLRTGSSETWYSFPSLWSMHASMPAEDTPSASLWEKMWMKSWPRIVSAAWYKVLRSLEGRTFSSMFHLT